jgi:hypothetical protein
MKNLSEAIVPKTPIKADLKKNMEGVNDTKTHLTPSTAKSEPKENLQEIDAQSMSCTDNYERKINSPSTQNHDSESEGHAHLVQYTRERNKERLRRRVARRSSIHLPMKELSSEVAEAARIGDVNILEKWLETNDVNAVDVSKFGHKRTALHKAAAHGRSHAVQMLLERGADPDCLDKFSRSPIFWAARHGHAIILQNLLDFGCEFELKDKFGKSPLDLAKEEHENECVAIIERFARSHARLVCMRVLGNLCNDSRLRAIWQWRIWMAEQNDNEVANRALDAAAKTHMLKQQYEREQTKAIEKIKKIHDLEIIELRQKLDDAMMLIKQLSHSPRASLKKTVSQSGSNVLDKDTKSDSSGGLITSFENKDEQNKNTAGVTDVQVQMVA